MDQPQCSSKKDECRGYQVPIRLIGIYIEVGVSDDDSGDDVHDNC
jgi:hypothetical protein